MHLFHIYLYLLTQIPFIFSVALPPSHPLSSINLASPKNLTGQHPSRPIHYTITIHTLTSTVIKLAPSKPLPSLILSHFISDLLSHLTHQIARFGHHTPIPAGRLLWDQGLWGGRLALEIWNSGQTGYQMSFGVAREVVEGLKGWFDVYWDRERRARECWMVIERDVEGERGGGDGGWEGRLWMRSG
ncbi:hypothetical protein G7Y79_00001g004140 [Physcia stellaris]|nr:hypothetical protein G7Y79_00001g004140 [Physcia stellaris]